MYIVHIYIPLILTLNSSAPDTAFIKRANEMSIYNEDELVHPPWINEGFFEQVLKQHEKNKSIEIKYIDISPASVKGDHYASIMFRCKITYNVENSLDSKLLSLIIKTLPSTNGLKRDLLSQSNLFETEISMYTEALPKIEKLLADCGEPTKLAAQIIYHSLEPHKVIVFEDLCKSGYNTLRERYLTEDEIKLIYRKLAKLHAASFVLGHGEHNECVTKYREGIFCNSTVMSMDLIANGIVLFINMLKQHEEFKTYLSKVQAMQPELTQNCKNLFNAFTLNKGQGDIFVLNHGDFHMRNLMFKFNAAEQMEDVIMVDYQISCYAPSNIDLMYSQYMLMSPELRLKKNALMHYYFESFTGMLKRLNFTGELPRYSDFQMANLKYRHFELFLVSTFLPMVLTIMVHKVEDLQDVDVAKYVEDPDSVTTVYENPEFINEMRRLLPDLLIEGYLD